jgi:hypothetical protein
MRRSVRIAALTASLATVLSGGLMATVASASAASASAGPDVHVINLHDARKAEKAHGVTIHRKAITLPRGMHKSSKTPVGNSCVEPNCNMVYGGGPVQTSPHVYLLLWGPNWSSDVTQSQTGDYMSQFYQGLGVVSVGDTWQPIMNQYTDITGQSVLVGTYQDTSTPPTGATQADLTAEADAFDAVVGIPPGTSHEQTVNSQVVIATQSGTNPSGFGSKYCAYHTWDDNEVPFTNMPYILDAGTSCGANFVSGPRDGITIIAGHEYAESLTDPYPNVGWADVNDPSGGEIGDKCAWSPLSGEVSMSTGTYAMQPLYSNLEQGCTMKAINWAFNPVSGLSGTARYTQLDASWKASANATSYKVIVTIKSGTIRVNKTIVTTPSFHLGSLKRGTRYAVHVLARPAAPNAQQATVYLTTK